MLHIIQNDPEVPPGNLLDSITVPFTLHHPYRGESLPGSGEISVLIVLGGSMGANDDAQYPFLTSLKILIRQIVMEGIPYLGICLGGQLLAAALGAYVVSNRWEEIGFFSVHLTSEGESDRLFQGVTSGFTTFQWHHDSFELPDGAVLLAESATCPHQAFRIGESAWGLQFHPEVTGKIIQDWCGWDVATSDMAGELRTQWAELEKEYCRTSRLIVKNFLP